MKHLLITTAAVLLVGCGTTQQSVSPAEAKSFKPVAEVAKPEPPTTNAPDISIHEAAADGNIEAVKQHLTAGTDVNAKGGHGLTPLHFAAGFSRGGVGKEIAGLLIANGADVNAKDSSGATPLGWAMSYPEIADLLRKHGGKTGEELKAEGK